MQHEAFPTWFSQMAFGAKAALLQLRRAMQDIAHGIARHPPGDIADFPFVLAESRTPLWGDAEWLLQTGKVQNLRCALRRLHRTRLPADAIFSFWKQIGAATRRRGYVEGRLLREGCLIPAVGGGLCQLSNALYEVALQAQLEIVERWGHSHIVPGSAAACGRDATVAWNYIDLRFRPAQDVLIEAFLTSDELVVRLRGQQKPFPAVAVIPIHEKERPLLDARSHSCASCGQKACFRHGAFASAELGCTAFLVDECWPEFQHFVARDQDQQDVLAIPLDGARWRLNRYGWITDDFKRVHAATVPTLMRSFAARRLRAYGAARLQAQIDASRKLAAHLSRALTPDISHVVAAQSLLPFLWREGHLGGRTYEVLMTRLPLHVLQARLDAAVRQNPERTTLREFRAPEWLVEAEQAALKNAHAVTPHGEIASLFSGRVTHLDWNVPAQCKVDRANTSRLIAFPGPTAARKGAYEVREAARSLGLEVLLRDSELEGEEFWNGIPTHRAAGKWLENVAAVVQPSLIEDQPRYLLQALAAGVPVIATASCGLEPTAGLTLVPAGDTSALIDALSIVLETGGIIG